MTPSNRRVWRRPSNRRDPAVRRRPEAGDRDTLDRVRKEAADPMIASTRETVLKQVGVVVGLLTQQDWPAANVAANALESDVHRSLLAEIAVAAQTEADKLLKSLATERMPPDVAVALVTSFPRASRRRSWGMPGRVERTATLAAKYAKVLAVMPAFSWDAKAASAAKKAAIDNNLIADKDTGISDALKAVGSAQSAFDEVLGPKVKADKKRPAGDKAIAAYESSSSSSTRSCGRFRRRWPGPSTATRPSRPPAPRSLSSRR